MTKNNFEQLNDLNVEFFESAKLSLLDPLGLYLANDVKWIKLNQNWNSLKFPVVMGGKGQPILLLHGFASSFLEFRRIYKSLKRNFQVVIPDLLGFGFSPRCATNEYNSSKIISYLVDLLKLLISELLVEQDRHLSLNLLLRIRTILLKHLLFH